MDRLTERVDMTHEYEYGANGFCCTDAEQLIKVLNNEESYMVATIDYGKTWALTKEELEDDK